MTANDRFLAKIEINRKTGCHEWVAAHSPFGYGIFRIENPQRKMVMAHRFAWERVNGKIPNGLLVLHKCDNPSCVSPAHLFLGTHQDNIVDKVRKGRSASGERNGAAKLKQEQIMEIRKIYAGGGETYLSLSEKYDVCLKTIQQIILFKTWRYSI